MAMGRERAEWGRLSCLMALIANCNRDPKVRKEPFTPYEFNCFEQTHYPKSATQEHLPLGKDGFALMKKLFVPEKRKRSSDQTQK